MCERVLPLSVLYDAHKLPCGNEGAVYEVEGFLTEHQCAQIIAYLKSIKGIRSTVREDGVDLPSDVRQSTTFMMGNHMDVCAALEQCRKKIITELFPSVPNTWLEVMQCTEYNVGDMYDYHYDAIKGAVRVATVLVYLNEGMVGGETHFPRLNDMKCVPTTGKALIFTPQTLSGTTIPDMIHSALPVLEGEKYVLQQWISKPIDK